MQQQTMNRRLQGKSEQFSSLSRNPRVAYDARIRQGHTLDVAPWTWQGQILHVKKFKV